MRWQGLTVRLLVAGGAAVLLLIPFTLLLIVARMPVNGLDRGVAQELHEFALAHPAVTSVLRVWTEVFGPWPWRIAVIAYAAWLLYKGAPRLALWAVTTITVGGVLGLV